MKFIIWLFLFAILIFMPDLGLDFKFPDIIFYKKMIQVMISKQLVMLRMNECYTYQKMLLQLRGLEMGIIGWQTTIGLWITLAFYFTYFVINRSINLFMKIKVSVS